MRLDLQSANFEGAALSRSEFDGFRCRQASFKGANLQRANLEVSGFNGADFSSANLAKAQLAHCSLRKARFAGAKLAGANLRLAELTGADLDTADRFKLFVQVGDDSLVGVVKSQSDPDLVYSCRLASDGAFACCTQNLNPCGGLRGALCKHLLVLIVGLANSGDLDPASVDNWIAASKAHKPALDRDLMSETLLRYKGAEAGEIDWRPTETLPEDFYAF